MRCQPAYRIQSHRIEIRCRAAVLLLFSICNQIEYPNTHTHTAASSPPPECSRETATRGAMARVAYALPAATKQRMNYFMMCSITHFIRLKI